MIDFNNRCAIVTGGASGVGEALVSALVARGARVAIGDISLDRAAAVASRLGDNVRGYRCDVTERGDVEALAAQVQRDMGDIHFVFPNAGIGLGGTLAETEVREFAWILDVNVLGVFHCIQVFQPLLVERARSGAPAAFVITGSDNSVAVTEAVCSAYAATKHAVLGLADALRRDLEGSGVGISILCPGIVNTNIWNGRMTRQERYGGAETVPSEVAETAIKIMAQIGQAPDLVAHLCLEGVARGDFIIMTDPQLRDRCIGRHQEIESSFDTLDARMLDLPDKPQGVT